MTTAKRLQERLRLRICEFDRRSPSILGEAEAEFASEQGYLPALVALTADPEAATSSAATWLIKSHLEAGGDLSRGQMQRIVDQLAQVNAWDARLHLCQCIQFLTFTLKQAEVLAGWLAPMLASDRPFLRAWSLDALCRLGAHHKALGPHAHAALSQAREDGSASVRARARRLAKIAETFED